MGFWKGFLAWLRGEPSPRTTRAERQARLAARAERVRAAGGDGGTDPGSAEAEVKLAERYLMMRMEDSAQHYCVRALERDPDHLRAKVTLARVFVAKGMPREARDALEGLSRGANADPEVQAVLVDIDALQHRVGGAAVVGKQPGESAASAPTAEARRARREIEALEGFREALEIVRGQR